MRSGDEVAGYGRCCIVDVYESHDIGNRLNDHEQCELLEVPHWICAAHWQQRAPGSASLRTNAMTGYTAILTRDQRVFTSKYLQSSCTETQASPQRGFPRPLHGVRSPAVSEPGISKSSNILSVFMLYGGGRHFVTSLDPPRGFATARRDSPVIPCKCRKTLLGM